MYWRGAFGGYLGLLLGIYRDQPGVRLLKAQLGGQVFLRARPGHRDVETDQVSLRLPAGDVFGETGSEVDQVASPRLY